MFGFAAFLVVLRFYGFEKMLKSEQKSSSFASYIKKYEIWNIAKKMFFYKFYAYIKKTSYICVCIMPFLKWKDCGQIID